MSTLNQLIGGLSFALFAWHQPATAQIDAARLKAAKEAIAEVANSVCDSHLPRDVLRSNGKVSGAAMAELDGIVKKLLANLGASVTASYELVEERRGLLEADILPAFKVRVSCRLNVFTTLVNRLLPDGQSLRQVFLLDTVVRPDVVSTMSDDLSAAGPFSLTPLARARTWDQQIIDIANKKPRVLIVHFHTLRRELTQQGQKVSNAQRNSEMALLRGLDVLLQRSPETRIILFSSVFDGSSKDTSAVLAATRRAFGSGRNQIAPDGTSLSTALHTLPWPKKSSGANGAALRAKVNALIA
jgi:hypothetical protein